MEAAMKTLPALLLVLTSLPVVAAAPIVLTPAADTTIRDGLEAPKDGTPDTILDGVVIQVLDGPQFEDRGIIEFSLASLDSPVSHARLTLPVFGANGPVPFRIDVFAYSGDGQVGLDDWSGGTKVASFKYRHKPAVRLNVTSAVNAALAAGQQFIGFRFEFAVPSPIELNGPFLSFNSLEFPAGGPPASLRVKVK